MEREPGEGTDLQSAGRRLEEIEAALQRIEEGSYGLCAACGDELSETELVRDPAGLLCGRCREASGPTGHPGQA